MARILALATLDDATQEVDLDLTFMPRQGDYVTVGSVVHEVRAVWHDGERSVVVLRRIADRETMMGRLQSEARSVPLAGGS